MKTLREYLIDLYTSIPLYEMAEQQKECERRVKSYLHQIIENTALVAYFCISGLHTTNLGHWKNELIAALWNACNFKLKGDNSTPRRKRLIARCFNEVEARNTMLIEGTIKAKFRTEQETGYRTNKNVEEYIGETVAVVKNMMDDIEELLVGGIYDDIEEFVDSM